ncbi:MAG: hypothetical protein ABSG43_27480 [Solirubrobacteraceae bacterium]
MVGFAVEAGFARFADFTAVAGSLDAAAACFAGVGGLPGSAAGATAARFAGVGGLAGSAAGATAARFADLT